MQSKKVLTQQRATSTHSWRSTHWYTYDVSVKGEHNIQGKETGGGGGIEAAEGGDEGEMLGALCTSLPCAVLVGLMV